MRRISVTTAVLAVLLGGGPAWSQSSLAIMELERVVAESNRMLDEHRAATQQNIQWATAALQAKDYAKARRYADPVSRADPKRIEAWLLLGAAHLGLEDWPKARLAYAKALRITPNHPEARAGMGIAMARASDPKARAHLAWFNAQIAACNGCWQARELSKFKAELETAMAAAAGPAGVP